MSNKDGMVMHYYLINITSNFSWHFYFPLVKIEFSESLNQRRTIKRASSFVCGPCINIISVCLQES